MNLVFVSGEDFSEAGASANRFIAYCKGLAELGHNVTSILIQRQKQDYPDLNIEGITFICVFPKISNYEKANKIKKLVLYIKSIKNFKQLINTIHENRKIDAIILLTTLMRSLVPFLCIAKSINVKLLHERTEFPSRAYGGRKMRNKPYLYFYLYFILRQFDGIYVISNALKKYFSKIVGSKTSVEIINMIVDPSRFKAVEVKQDHGNMSFAYCGTLNSEKDGVDILVKAFCRALAEGKISRDVRLKLIGGYSDERFIMKLKKIINECNCYENVIFTGLVTRDEIPELLNSASAFALARPGNKQSEGGFPTKLGEYLATGKPVVITDVGEISLFLKDGYNAFIAIPDDIESFSGKIAEVFKDYPHALEIGKRGRMLTENEFNYLEQAKKLARFIESL